MLADVVLMLAGLGTCTRSKQQTSTRQKVMSKELLKKSAPDYVLFLTIKLFLVPSHSICLLCYLAELLHLLPIFANEILLVGSEGLGVLRAAPSVGALLMAFYITHHPIKKNTGKILLYCVAGFGVCMILVCCLYQLLALLVSTDDERHVRLCECYHSKHIAANVNTGKYERKGICSKSHIHRFIE